MSSYDDWWTTGGDATALTTSSFTDNNVNVNGGGGIEAPRPSRRRTPSPSFDVTETSTNNHNSNNQNSNTATLLSSPVVATTARSALERWLGDTYFTTTANANAATNNINSSQSRNDNLNVNGPTTTTMTSNNGNNNSPNNNDNSADNESDDEDEDEWARLTISTASGIDNIMTPTNINSTNLPLETMANLATANALATTELLNARLFEHISGGSGSGSGADNDTVGAAVERVGSGVTASAAAAAAVGPPDSFASLYALNYGIGGAPAGTTTAFAASASRSNIGGNIGGGGIDITSLSTRSSFTPVTSTSQSTSPPPPSTTLPAHQRRQQQRLRDYQRQQQQQQLRHYERQYQQRLRSNLITASMSSSISRQQQRQRELMQEFGEGSRSSGQQHTQTQQQQRQPTHHPYLPRTSRSSLQSIERARSLAGIRERRLQRERNNNNHHLEEQFSTSDWNTYQSVRAELNDRRTAADAAADAAAVANDDDGGEGEDDDVESVEIDIESFEEGEEEDSGTNDEEYPFINDLVNDFNRRAIANNRSTGVIVPRSNWDPHQTIRRGITEEHERTGREYREIAIEWVRLGRAEFIPGIGRLGDLPPLSLNHGGGEGEEEELPILEDNEFSLFASARPPSSASDNSSNMPGLQPMDQEGSDGGSPSTATTTTAASSSAASSASPVVANVPTSTTNTAVPTRRSQRQAAVQCMERISAAIATGGMGSDYNNDSADESKKQPTTKKSPSSKKAPPSEVAGKPSAIFSKTATCCICLEVPTEEELSAINGCDHPYCFTCIETWANRENTCPLCKARFTNIEKVNFKSSKRKRGGGEMSSSERKSKKVRTRNQRADINMSNPLQGLFASIEASGALPAQIAQLLFSGLGGPTFGGRPRPSAAAAAASRASSRSASTTAAASSASAVAAASRPSTQSRFSQRGPMHMTTTSITLPPILDMPTLDPFGLSSVPSFGSPFGGTFGGGPPTPWNSSPPSSSASPFSYRSSAASRARSQGAAAAAATAASSPFNYPGSSFEGFLARHDDDLFRSLSSPTPPSSQHHASHQRRSGGTTSRTREFDFDSFGREAHPYTMRMRMRMRNLEEERRGRGSAAPSSRSSISNRSRPSSGSGTNNRSPAPAAAAGTSRETALEIHDSDDEVVEVIDLVS